MNGIEWIITLRAGRMGGEVLHPLKSEWKVENWVRLHISERGNGRRKDIMHHSWAHTHTHTHISGSALPSLQDIYLKRCKSRAAKIIKDSTHPGNHLSVYCHLASASGAWWQKPRDWGGAFSLRPSGSLTQTQFHKHLQDSFTFTIIRIAATCIYPVQPVCTSLLHIPVHITIY